MKKQFLLRYLICYKREIVSVLFFSLLSSVMTVACSTIMNNVIAETLSGNGSNLWTALALLCCIAVVWVIFVYAQRYTSGKLGVCLTQKLRQDVTEKLMAVRYDCFMEQESGTFLNRLNDDIKDTAEWEKKGRQDKLTNIIQESFASTETEKSFNLQERNLKMQKMQ